MQSLHSETLFAFIASVMREREKKTNIKNMEYRFYSKIKKTNRKGTKGKRKKGSEKKRGRVSSKNKKARE